MPLTKAQENLMWELAEGTPDTPPRTAIEVLRFEEGFTVATELANEKLLKVLRFGLKITENQIKLKIETTASLITFLEKGKAAIKDWEGEE